MTGNGSGRWRPRTFRVAFGEGHAYEGLEVVMRPASVDGLFGMYESAEALADGKAGAAGQAKGFRELCEALAPFVVSWNVDDEMGNPVAADAAGLMAQEPGVVTEIFTGWAQRMVAVEPPLPGGSAATRPPRPGGDSDTERELQIPATPLPSPAS